MESFNFFDVGAKNYYMLQRLFKKNDIVIAGKDVGGNKTRTLFLEVGSGKTWLQSNSQSWAI